MDKALKFAKLLPKYAPDWIAYTKDYEIVAHAKTFAGIMDKVKERKDVILMPASTNYYGFVMEIHG